MAKKSPRSSTDITAITHDDATRKNIPTAELQSVMRHEVQAPVRVAYAKRNPDLDPQLVWRGKYDGDDVLNIMAPPLYIQEKVHPKALVEDLLREAAATKAAEAAKAPYQLSLFGDFNGIPDDADKTDFYQHDQNWTNRMILGDSLQVMASLAEREGLRGQVQCIYLDPPYGIKFNSNFQWSTTNRDVKDGKIDNLTREPEQVKAFRDTWRDGIHSYLSYLRDRFIVARDLLTESGSIFVQIGDENVHRVRAVLDEVFGEGNFVSQIWFRKKTMPLGANLLEQMGDWILFYAKNKECIKYNKILFNSSVEEDSHWNVAVFNDATSRQMTREEIDNHKKIDRTFDPAQLISMSPVGYSEQRDFEIIVDGKVFYPAQGKSWKTDKEGMQRLGYAKRLEGIS